MSTNTIIKEVPRSQWPELEQLVERHGVRSVVNGLIEVCRKNAAESGPTWVGEINRQEWEHAASRLEAALCHMEEPK